MLIKSFIIFLLLALISCRAQQKSPDTGSETTSNTSTTIASGAPIINTLKYYNHFPFNHVYTLNIQVGAQTIETVLDTGSSNLLVIGDSADCSNCVNEYGYNSVYTPTSIGQKLNTSWSMNFAPIGFAQVEGFVDTVAFANHNFPNFSFGLVTSEQGIPNIWGIAYQSLASPSSSPQLPLFDALVQTVKLQNIFSLRLCGLRGASNVVLGGYDTAVSNLLPQVKWTYILEKRWYPVQMTKMYTHSSDLSTQWVYQPDTSDTVIVDSGTNPLVLSSDAVVAIVEALKTVAQKHGVSLPSTFWPKETGQGGYATISDADVAKFPTLYLDFVNAQNTNTTFTLSISPQTYFQTTQGGKKFFGMEGSTGSTVILGTVFMENYIVLHNRGTPTAPAINDTTAMLGFYPNTGLCQ